MFVHFFVIGFAGAMFVVAARAGSTHAICIGKMHNHFRGGVAAANTFCTFFVIARPTCGIYGW